MRLIWSPEAEKDLEGIWSYLAQQSSIARADARAGMIIAACDRLSEWPMSGRRRDNIRPGLRSVPVVPDVIFYRVAAQCVEIVRIIDGRRDIEAEFADKP